MPDRWELANGLDPKDAADALLDADAEGLANANEYAAGTDPKDPASCLVLKITRLDNGLLRMAFVALEGRSYLLQSSQALGDAWQPLMQVFPEANGQVSRNEHPN